MPLAVVDLQTSSCQYLGTTNPIPCHPIPSRVLEAETSSHAMAVIVYSSPRLPAHLPTLPAAIGPRPSCPSLARELRLLAKP